jgi:hypothetical protein
MTELKLFVWEGDGVLTDYTNGMICVLAHDLEEALKLIGLKDPVAMGNFNPNDFKVIATPEAFTCWGGG